MPILQLPLLHYQKLVHLSFVEATNSKYFSTVEYNPKANDYYFYFTKFSLGVWDIISKMLYLLSVEIS